MAAPRVIFLSLLATNFGRGVLRGVRAYVRQFGPWAVSLYEKPIRASGPPLRNIDGAIAQVSRAATAAGLRASGIPTVNVSNFVLNVELPRVASDDRAVGRLGAEHFLRAGFRNLAYCGFTGIHGWHGYSALRAEGFRARAGEAGLTARWFEAERPPGGNTDSEGRDIANWLKSLPRPVGVMAANDVRGVHVLTAGQQIGLRFPDEVAVLGVDNDEMECERASLPLSSIALDFPRIGYEAAAALAKLMAGESVEDHYIAPLHVVARQSSDILCIDDPALATAVRFIRERAGKQIQVEQVAEAAMLSRRSLERRFRAVMGISPHDEISRCHVERAKQLLAETSLGMGEVAAASGFRDAKTLSMLFRHATGMPPTDYRKKFRSHVS